MPPAPTQPQPAASPLPPVFVLDTGLRASHADFKGRVGQGATFVGSSYAGAPRRRAPGQGAASLPICAHPLRGSGARLDVGGHTAHAGERVSQINVPAPRPLPPARADDHGHGTHAAGTAVGAVHGVASQAVLHPVKVCGVGTWGEGVCLCALEHPLGAWLAGRGAAQATPKLSRTRAANARARARCSPRTALASTATSSAACSGGSIGGVIDGRHLHGCRVCDGAQPWPHLKNPTRAPPHDVHHPTPPLHRPPRRVKSYVQKNGMRSAVVSMSLGGPRSAALNDAAADLAHAGITVVTAAGAFSGGEARRTRWCCLRDEPSGAAAPGARVAELAAPCSAVPCPRAPCRPRRQQPRRRRVHAVARVVAGHHHGRCHDEDGAR